MAHGLAGVAADGEAMEARLAAMRAKAKMLNRDISDEFNNVQAAPPPSYLRRAYSFGRS